MQSRDIFICHDHHALAVADLADQIAGLRQQTGADQNVVLTAFKAHMNGLHCLNL